MQVGVLDFIAISVGIAAAVRPAAMSLTLLRPPQALCSFRNSVLLLVHCMIACCVVFGCARLLVTQPWYKGSAGQADHVSLYMVCHSVSVKPKSP